MQRVFTITETGTTESGGVVNLAHVFSSFNRKYIPQVDKKGNAQLFHINVRSISDGANTVTLRTAPNSYVTKQATKAWHKAWRQQFSDAKIPIKSLGPYGQNLRVSLESSDTYLGSGEEDGSGEWTSSDVIITPAVDPGDNTNMETDKMVDKFKLHLCGATTSDGHEDVHRFTSAGMLTSWIDSRKKPSGLDGDSVTESQLVGTDNPLLHTRGRAFTTELLVEEVREFQAEEPPYDDALSEAVMVQGMLKSNADLIGERMVQVPLGLLQVSFTAACTLEFELLAITDME